MSTVTEAAAADVAVKSVIPLAIGAAAKSLREALGLTVQQLAVLVKEDFPKIQQFEAGAWAATEDLLAKYEAAFNVNLHLYAVAFQVEVAKLPAKIQPVVAQLKSLWSEEIAAAAAAFRSATGQTSTPAAPPVQQATPASATDPNPSHPGAVMPDGTVQQAEPAPLPDPQAASESPHSDVPGAGS